MSTTVIIVGAAILARMALITALVMQRRCNRRGDESAREQQRLTAFVTS